MKIISTSIFMYFFHEVPADLFIKVVVLILFAFLLMFMSVGRINQKEKEELEEENLMLKKKLGRA